MREYLSSVNYSNFLISRQPTHIVVQTKIYVMSAKGIFKFLGFSFVTHSSSNQRQDRSYARTPTKTNRGKLIHFKGTFVSKQSLEKC